MNYGAVYCALGIMSSGEDPIEKGVLNLGRVHLTCCNDCKDQCSFGEDLYYFWILELRYRRRPLFVIMGIKQDNTMTSLESLQSLQKLYVKSKTRIMMVVTHCLKPKLYSFYRIRAFFFETVIMYWRPTFKRHQAVL